MRKILVGRSVVWALVLLAACSGEGSSPVAGNTVPALKTSATDVASFIGASGEGELTVTAPAAAIGPAQLQFSAVQHKNGNITGSFRVVRRRAGFLVDFTGNVTCVSIDPVTNRAWIGGVVTANNSDDPNHTLAIHSVGRDVWFRVQDNGEGSQAEADRSSVLGFEGGAGVITSAEYCQRQLWTAGNANAFELVAGNIQVR